MKKIHFLNIFIGIVASLSVLAISANADVVFPDDVIVDGSQCVGTSCVEDMSFGFDTLVLSEENLRIYFEDTSTSASFPTNDWRILINDIDGAGTGSFFAIEDVETTNRPFTIQAGAPDNTLFLNSSGYVGVGTDSPTHTLHVDGNMLVTGNLEIGSSRKLKENIHSLDIESASSALAALEPVKFSYKTSPEEETLGFIAEDVPELVASKNRDALSTMDIVAVLTKVVQSQQEKITRLKQEVSQLEELANKN